MWANGCDFPGYDLVKLAIPASECGAKCLGQSEYYWPPSKPIGCNAFVYFNGICYLKKVPLNYLRRKHSSASCGIINMGVY